MHIFNLMLTFFQVIRWFAPSGSSKLMTSSTQNYEIDCFYSDLLL